MIFDKVIIDFDPLIYRCGFAVEKLDKITDIVHVEPIANAYYNIDNMVKKTLKIAGTNAYQSYLTSSDKSNFRYDLFPAYKDNRKDARRPIYYKELRDYAVKKWGATVVSGQEADDACSIAHCLQNPLGFDKSCYNSLVCSFDKDFNNIPGWHYNYVKGDVYYLSEIEALRNFYLQILTGDTSDGIPRIKKGWRQKKVEESISKAETEKELFAIVFNEIYCLQFPKEVATVLEDIKEHNWMNRQVDETIIQRGRLVWLRRKENELWTPLGGIGYEKY